MKNLLSGKNSLFPSLSFFFLSSTTLLRQSPLPGAFSAVLTEEIQIRTGIFLSGIHGLSARHGSGMTIVIQEIGQALVSSVIEIPLCVFLRRVARLKTLCGFTRTIFGTEPYAGHKRRSRPVPVKESAFGRRSFQTGKTLNIPVKRFQRIQTVRPPGVDVIMLALIKIIDPVPSQYPVRTEEHRMSVFRRLPFPVGILVFIPVPGSRHMQNFRSAGRTPERQIHFLRRHGISLTPHIRLNRIVYRRRNAVVKLHHIPVNPEIQLLLIRKTDYSLRGFLRTLQCREQKGRQNRNNSDHHQKFNQRKTSSSPCRNGSTILPQHSGLPLLLLLLPEKRVAFPSITGQLLLLFPQNAIAMPSRLIIRKNSVSKMNFPSLNQFPE